MPYQWAAVIAYTMVVIVFVVDWITPASVIVDVAYEAPVVFAALKGNRRLTGTTIGVGITGIGLGWFVDLAQASFVFSNVRIENRLLSVFSILIVGALAIMIQGSAERAIAFAGMRARKRATTVASAVDRIMSALSNGTTVQTITSEAPRYLEATGVVWCPAQGNETSWSFGPGDSKPEKLELRPSAALAALVQRVMAQNSVATIDTVAALDANLCETLGSSDALAIPIGLGTSNAGVLFASVASSTDGNTLAAAGHFAKLSSTAMQQAEPRRRVARARDGDSGPTSMDGAA